MDAYNLGSSTLKIIEKYASDFINWQFNLPWYGTFSVFILEVIILMFMSQIFDFGIGDENI